MDEALALHERTKYERMWTFDAYRDDHASSHAEAAVACFGVQPGESIIDVGAGAGFASRSFQASGLRVLAIDIAANAMAPDIASRVPVLVANLWDVPVDLSADWGFCCDVMEHIPTGHVDRVLEFIRRSTRRATYFSISLRPDGCGRLIGQPLHLTVEPLAWWTTRLGAWWRDLRLLRHDPGEAVELVADGRAGPQPTGGRTA